MQVILPFLIYQASFLQAVGRLSCVSFLNQLLQPGCCPLSKKRKHEHIITGPCLSYRLEVTATDISQPIRSRAGSHFISTTSDNVSLYTQTQASFFTNFRKPYLRSAEDRLAGGLI